LLSWRPNRHLLALIALAAVVVVIDQISKALVVQFFGGELHASVDLAGNWLRLSYVTNTGAAFGMLPDQKWLFLVVAALVIPIILYLGGTETAEAWPMRASLGLMLGGTVGNLIDRLRLGYVVDFVDVGVGSWRWPSFNVADSAFVVGTIIVITAVLLWPQPQVGRQVGDDTPPA
jgi:signal peptidase II